MLALICSKAVVFTYSLMLLGPGESFRKLPTPAAVEREITSRLLTNYQKMLDAATKARQKLEKRRDENPKFRESYADSITYFEEMEASYRRRIESLERGQLTPPMETFRPR